MHLGLGDTDLNGNGSINIAQNLKMLAVFWKIVMWPK